MTTQQQTKRKFINVPQLHQRIPAFRQMMYGKDKAKYAPNSLHKSARRQYLLKQIKTLNIVGTVNRSIEYTKFTKDIRGYNFQKPIDVNLLEELDFEDIQESFPTYGSYLCYDDSFMVGRNTYRIYLVKYKTKNFVCIYRFGRYFDNLLKHPSTQLLFTIPISS